VTKLSIDEEGAWWDTHDADGNELEPEDLVENYREDGSFRVRLSPEDLRELTEEAKRLRMRASVLAGEILWGRLHERSKRIA
jgi:hypothetical protein